MGKEYVDSAESDAWDTLENFLDEVIEQIVDSGEASDDLHNDYDAGDEYHHENHVDKAYDLQEAAKLLGELSDFEETDYGLWQGLEPRKAIAAQAAYTYGNAVLSEWRDLISSLNNAVGGVELDENEDPEKFWPVFVRAWVLLYPLESKDFDGMVQAAWNDLLTGGFGTLRMLSDKMEDTDAVQHKNKIEELRKLASTDIYMDKDDDDEPDDGEAEADGGAD